MYSSILILLTWSQGEVYHSLWSHKNSDSEVDPRIKVIFFIDT